MVVKMDEVFTLYDDESVTEKLKVMDKWDAMMDDERNPSNDIAEKVEALLELGKSYRVTIVVEEMPPVCDYCRLGIGAACRCI